MIVVLPKKNVPLQSTLDMLTRIPFTNVIHALEKSVIDFGEDRSLLPFLSSNNPLCFKEARYFDNSRLEIVSLKMAIEK